MRYSIFYYLLFIILFSTSCVQYKNVAYVQDSYGVKDTTKQSISVAEGGDLVLREGDNVYINTYGLEPEQLSLFNKEKTTSSSISSISLYLKGYFINDSGYVEMPVIGKVKIAGLNLAQAKDSIQSKMNEYLVGSVVDIRLLSYNITILGEVKKQGKYQFYKREINILDAIAKAGDLGTYGDARNIILMRNVNGVIKTYKFDITSLDFFSDPNFWLKPDDVIYVKPLKAKMISVNTPALSIVLAGLSTLILLLTYVRSF